MGREKEKKNREQEEIHHLAHNIMHLALAHLRINSYYTLTSVSIRLYHNLYGHSKIQNNFLKLEILRLLKLELVYFKSEMFNIN